MGILVTGGAGFIGCNLVRRLRPLNDVAVVDDLSTGQLTNLDDLGARVEVGSIADLAHVREAASGCRSIVHLAARGSVPRSIADPLGTHLANATGTLMVAEVAREFGVPLILSSSSSVYGANTSLPKSERDWTQPMSPYAASKLAAESYALAYQSSYGLPVLAFRFFNVFGPWQRPDHDYAAVVPKWLWRAMNGDVIEVYGDGTQTRDFTYVDTVVDVLESAVTRQLTHDGPVNLAFGNRHSLLELLEEVERIVGRALRVEFLPERPGDVRNSENDPRLVTSLFPDVRPVPFDDALDRTAAWLDDHAAALRSPGS